MLHETARLLVLKVLYTSTLPPLTAATLQNTKGLHVALGLQVGHLGFDVLILWAFPNPEHLVWCVWSCRH